VTPADGVGDGAAEGGGGGEASRVRGRCWRSRGAMRLKDNKHVGSHVGDSGTRNQGLHGKLVRAMSAGGNLKQACY
jgi:hypothetical protein